VSSVRARKCLKARCKAKRFCYAAETEKLRAVCQRHTPLSSTASRPPARAAQKVVQRARRSCRTSAAGEAVSGGVAKRRAHGEVPSSRMRYAGRWMRQNGTGGAGACSAHTRRW